MKLSKKDKIMLVVLAVIMFVAIFFVYGIMPTKDQIAELDAVIATKQTAANELQMKLQELMGQQQHNNLDAVMAFHYDNKKPGHMPEVLDKLGLEEMLHVFLKSYHVEGYPTTSWTILEQSYNSSYNGVVVTNQYSVAKISIPFKMETEAYFRTFIDRLNSDPNFTLINYSLQINEKPEETETPDPSEPPKEEETFYEVTGAMNFEYYMGEKYDSPLETLYKSMDSQLTNVAVKDGAIDTVVCDKLDATKYEKAEYRPYSVVVGDNNARTYTKIHPSKYIVREVGDKVEIELTDLKEDTDIAVMAIGGVKAEKRFYKSPLNDETPLVKLAPYYSAGDVVGVVRDDFDTLSFPLVNSADLVNVKYNIKKVDVNKDNGDRTYTDMPDNAYEFMKKGDRAFVKFVDIAPNTMVAIEISFEDKDGLSYKTDLDRETPLYSMSLINEGKDVTNLTANVGGRSDTISFDKVAGAESYTLYTFTADASGKRTYDMVPPLYYVVDESNADTVTIQVVNESIDAEDVVVSVVSRDKDNNCYRTVLKDSTPSVNVTAYKTFSEALTIAMHESEPNTVVLNDITAKYTDIVYGVYEVSEADGKVTYNEVKGASVVATNGAGNINLKIEGMTAGKYKLAIAVKSCKGTDGKNYEGFSATSNAIEVTIA